MHSLYWSKSGDWYEVQVSTEAEAFLDGVPGNASVLRLISGSRGGFVKPGGGFRAREERLELDAVLICCHGGPGEDGTLQGALDLAGVRYSGPTAMGAALGMDKLAFGALMVQAGLPALPRIAFGERSEAPGFAPAVHPEAAIWRLIDRSRGRRGLRDRSRTPERQRAPPSGCGARALPRGDVRPPGGRSNLARTPAFRRRATAEDPRRRRDPGLPGQVRRT